MELLVEQGSSGHCVISFPLQERLRSSSCGVHPRSMQRQHRSCGDLHGRTRSTGRLRRKSISEGQPPPQEVQLRPERVEIDQAIQKQAMHDCPSEEATNAAQCVVASEEDLKVSCNWIADWVGSVAGDIIDDQVGFTVFVAHDCSESGNVDIWESVSTGSFDEWDDGDVPEFAPGQVCFLEPYALVAKEIGDAAVVEVKDQIQIPRAPSPTVASPDATPSSRSSTPSRSVRHRRRIIGGIQRTASPAEGFAALSGSWLSEQRDAAAASPQPRLNFYAALGTSMKRASSTSALALDLGPEAATISTSTIPSTTSLRAGAQGELRIPSCIVGKVFKSKSTGSLHVSSSKLASPMTPSKQRLLPILMDEQGSKADLIAWSVNMTKTKRGGIRLAF